MVGAKDKRMRSKREGFYKAFEDKFRGDHDIIKSRLRVYLPFIAPLKEFYDGAHVVDLGCGRGEWLELLGEHGFSAQGVDLDDEMLVSCRDRGLNVQMADALSFTKGLADESVTVVSGLHLVEHIAFEDLQSLVEESLRVLKPGGLLILETPNPENIIVGSSAFYLDPTHRKPIPPSLLAFLAEYYGFRRVKVLRLQEPENIASRDSISLLNVLNSASPDYAVIAQKNADEKLLDITSSAFAAEYGVTLVQLASKYDERITQIEAQARQAEERAALSEAAAQQAGSQARRAEDRAALADTAARRAEERVAQAEAALHAIYNSRSWRIAAPVRWMTTLARRGRDQSKRALKRLAAPLLARSIRLAKSRPWVKSAALRWIRKYPGLEVRLRRFGAARGLIGTFFNEASIGSAHAVSMTGPLELTELSPRAREIYFQLKAAIEQE